MNFETYEKTGQTEYAALAEEVEAILSAAIARHDDVRLQHIQRRAKAPASLKKKLARDGALESPEIEAAVKDLAGVRVILYTNSDVDRLLGSGIIHDNFEVDWDRTKIHHPPRDPSKATELFVSNNYVVKLREARIALPEYARFAGMWCEVQVQTTLNHAWSEMAHDTIYKKPELSGFGGELMQGIEDRMKAIMQKYLAPAGYEFQKVLMDAERLASGKALFDQGAIDALGACANNNERHDVLERFLTYVLPHYDDYRSIAAEIISAICGAVKTARDTEVVPIDTPFGSLPGHTAHDIASQAERVIECLRYADVATTLETIAELHASAGDPDERNLWVKAAEALAKHDLKVWRQVGPRVQTMLVEWLRALPEARLVAIRPVALAVLREVVGSELSGSTLADYKTITLHQGAVLASEELRQTRAAAIELLTTLFRTAGDDAARREVMHALAAASAMPGMGGPSADLARDILTNARQIVAFYTAEADAISFELRQALEHDLFWLRYHTDRREAQGDPPELSAARSALLETILAFRDKVNADPEFVIYKTLVGFESVFPPAWDDPERDHADEAYRTRAIEALVGDVAPETADAWLERVRRCAATESNDMATFPPFGRFLEAVGRAKPEVMAGFLEQADDRLARFLTPMLSGLVETDAWARAERTLTEWVRQRRYLSEIAWAVRNVEALSSSLLSEIFGAAVEVAGDEAVWSVLAAAVARFDVGEERDPKNVALSAIRHLGGKGDQRWVNALTSLPRPERSGFLLGLDEGEAGELLQLLVSTPRIEYRIEDLIAAIGANWPQAVIDFFGGRLRYEKTASEDRYDAVPFQLHRLDSVLAAHPEELIAASRSWFEEDRSLFEYRGAKLITGVFPGFSDRLEELLLERVATGDRNEIAFALGVMRAYDGEAFLHPLCREIVAVLPADDELLNVVSIVLDAMGVTTGEFGRVEGFRRKKSEIEPWLADSRSRQSRSDLRHTGSSSTGSAEVELLARASGLSARSGVCNGLTA